MTLGNLKVLCERLFGLPVAHQVWANALTFNRGTANDRTVMNRDTVVCRSCTFGPPAIRFLSLWGTMTSGISLTLVSR